jgi:hypothetical protein
MSALFSTHGFALSLRMVAAAGCAVAGLATAVLVAAAPAASAAPAWRAWALANSAAAPGGTLDFVVEAHNVGDAPADPGVAPTAFTGSLPAGVTVQSVETESPSFDCSSVVSGSQTFTCQGSGAVNPQESVRFNVATAVDGAAQLGGLLTASFTVAGGGAPAAATSASSTVSDSLPPFGVSAFDAPVTADAAGTPFTQAAGHPLEASTFIDFNTFKDPNPMKSDLTPVQALKDVNVDLPAGFFGDASHVGRCTLAQLSHTKGLSPQPLCPVSSQVGTTIVLSNGFSPHGPLVFGPLPVYNMEPPSDAPARLGFNVSGNIVTLDVGVRTGSDYGLIAHVRNISEGVAIAGTSVTLWGVPSDPVHDPERACPGEPAFSSGGPTCQAASGGEAHAFLRNPTSCSQLGEGLATSVSVDSWAHPGVFTEPKTVYSHSGKGYPYPEAEWGPRQGTTGCGKVPFEPSFSDSPSTGEAGAPTGFQFDLRLPQPDEAGTIAESDLRKAVVTLPAGVRISPSAAGGLQACSPVQIGLHEAGDPSCPDASRLGSVSIKTPALENPLTGSIYLATPHENPFGTLVAIYLIAKGSGVTVKLAGKIELDPSTGQLTTTIDENPQQPFTDVRLEFDGGPRAPLTTPEACGAYTTHGQFTGWSGRTVESNPMFTIATGPAGGACAAPGFAPSFTAGATNPIAGGFSPFVLSFSRQDGEQQIAGLTDTFPPGASAVLKGVARCSDADVKAAEAGTGTCPEASRIGSVTVGSGAGPDPYFLKGSVYLTGPYNNGPFGEAVIVPAVAGPFNLGNVVVRGSIRIDPHTAQPTVVSDPFPQFVKSTGIPTDIRRVDVDLDRPNFTFNPTNCSELKATATLTGSAGAVANVSSRFAAAECRSLAFHPGFRVATVAKTSRRLGAALHVTVTSGPGQANIRSVHVSLPKALPSRLTTLQKACSDPVFSVNPAACPPESRVGTASAVTPLLAAKLSGPVYFVSHGGAKFPELVVVLQGEGVTVMLGGETFINEKTSVTSSTFRAVPDTPVTRFELTLPQGRFSALAAIANLCKRKLAMPTRIVGQNGAVVQRRTRIAVKGCPKAKAHRRGKRK